MNTIITFTSITENGSEVTQTLPAQWASCLGCAGTTIGHDGKFGTCEECVEGEVAVVVRKLADPDVLAAWDDLCNAVFAEDLALAK